MTLGGLGHTCGMANQGSDSQFLKTETRECISNGEHTAQPHGKNLLQGYGNEALTNSQPCIQDEPCGFCLGPRKMEQIDPSVGPICGLSKGVMEI